MAHPQKLMLWGMISVHGPRRLVPVYGNMKKEEYKDILLTQFMPQWREWDDSNSMKLLHDGAPSHKSRIITELLEEKGVQVVDWPGNSPDLNPIENI